MISCLKFQIRHNSLFMIRLQLDGVSYFLRPVFAYLRAVIAIENRRNLHRGLSRSVHAPGNPMCVLKCRRNLSSQAFRKDKFLPFLRKDTSTEKLPDVLGSMNLQLDTIWRKWRKLGAWLIRREVDSERPKKMTVAQEQNLVSHVWCRYHYRAVDQSMNGIAGFPE